MEPGNLADPGLGLDGPFRTIPAATRFDSLIVHELTHALYDAVGTPGTQSFANDEYIAHAMQLQSLDPIHPETLLAAVGPHLGGLCRAGLAAFRQPGQWLRFRRRDRSGPGRSVAALPVRGQTSSTITRSRSEAPRAWSSACWYFGEL
ncbi:hypothetical protein EV216_11024 [Rhodovulum steppense]|uniref:Uncharacterized protein n=1 Tax=Rhodovulum steppense TaxID=540251 RepID=A0A4R1YUE3_9RHOB|nr:hypothetical protein EV216_11024 [Rhodovulum steppense]